MHAHYTTNHARQIMPADFMRCQQTQNISITLYNADPKSSMLNQHCINVTRMFCVCWGGVRGVPGCKGVIKAGREFKPCSGVLEVCSPCCP